MRQVHKQIACSFAVATILLLLGGAAASAQTPHVLAPVLTDQFQQYIAGLSNKFGVPAASVVNDAGDFAFIGNRSTGLYYRAAGASAITRAIQYGDEVPGLTGSRLFAIYAPLYMNSSGVVAVLADVATTGRLVTAVLTYDGTTLTVVATGFDTAPGTGGAKYGRAMNLRDINNNGDVLFGGSLLPIGSTSPAQNTVFLDPASGAIVRVAGPGDVAPGTGGGTFTSVTGVSVTDSGQVLLYATITGGTGTSGIFAWQSGTLRKVVASGDANPLGGTFTDSFTIPANMGMANSGLIVFRAGGSLWQNTEAASPQTSVAVAVGASAPAPMGGTYSNVTSLSAVGDGDDAVFQADVTGGAGTFGLFRFRPGAGVEVVARQNEVPPGSPASLFGQFVGVSVNSAGTVSFQGNAAGQPTGVYQKPAGGALALYVPQAAGSPVGGQVVFHGLPTDTLSSGLVLIRAHIINAPVAHHAHILWSGTPVVMMSTAAVLPPGARVFVRPPMLTGAGGYLGFSMLRAGGRESVGIFSPYSQEANVVGTDGDSIWGGRLQLGSTNTVIVSSSGTLAVQGSIIGPYGGPIVINALLTGDVNQPLQPLTADGSLDNNNRPLFSATIGTRPIALNALGDLAFTATYNNQKGIWVGSLFTGVDKIAVVGDVVSTGQTITAITNVAGFNTLGQVLFTATTAAGQGLFVALAGEVPVKVAQVGDAPLGGGGTFSGFGAAPMPGFNVLGQVAFLATTSGGPGAGIYLASPSGSPTTYTSAPIALNGALSPEGGTYAISTVRPEVLINNSQDIAFMADLAGGSANSAIFIRRGPAGAVAVAVKQGQPAPGTAEVFSTFQHGVNNLVGELFALNETGHLAFIGWAQPVSGTAIIGWWHLEPDDSLQPILIVPSTLAELGGGTAASLAQTATWMSSATFPMWVPAANGPTASGLYMYVPAEAAAITDAGASVTVYPTDAVTRTAATVTFSTVTSAGETTLVRSGVGPALPRGWYYNPGLAIYYNITTTAAYAGSIEVCLDFWDQVQSSGGVPSGAVIQLLHYTGGAWVNVTSSPLVGTYICGTTSSLSTFVVALALNEPETNIVQNGDFGNGATSWQVYATDGTQQDNSYIVWAVNNGVFEYYRLPPPSGSNQAVVLQNTGVPFAEGDTIIAHFDLGNSSSVRKRISVLIHDKFFGDLAVCTFWLPPNTPMRPYAMRTHTTAAWTDASISFYAATAGSDGGVYQLDNVVMGAGNGFSTQRTDCVDPGEPGTSLVADGPQLLANPSFTDGLNSWTAYGTITAQVTGGVAEFIRPSNTAPSGVLLQQTFTGVGSGTTLAATFQLGNSSASRKRITVILHDFTWGDLTACTFWLPAGQPLMPYIMRTYTTQAWSNATISFYPATTDTDQWFELDDVTLTVSPSTATFGTDCVEPFGDEAFTPGAPAPAPQPAPVPAAAEVPIRATDAGRPFQGRRTRRG